MTWNTKDRTRSVSQCFCSQGSCILCGGLWCVFLKKHRCGSKEAPRLTWVLVQVGMVACVGSSPEPRSPASSLECSTLSTPPPPESHAVSRRSRAPYPWAPNPADNTPFLFLISTFPFGEEETSRTKRKKTHKQNYRPSVTITCPEMRRTPYAESRLLVWPCRVDPQHHHLQASLPPCLLSPELCVEALPSVCTWVCPQVTCMWVRLVRVQLCGASVLVLCRVWPCRVGVGRPAFPEPSADSAPL